MLVVAPDPTALERVNVTCLPVSPCLKVCSGLPSSVLVRLNAGGWMIVAVSLSDVPEFMPAPLAVAELFTLPPEARDGVTVTTMLEKMPPAAFTDVLVHVTTVEVEVPQFQSAPPLMLD